ncbi:MAG: hypothetical protein JWR33_2531 [Naasia sp.]|nr:hypothetical protein [Naasia sp.]
MTVTIVLSGCFPGVPPAEPRPSSTSSYAGPNASEIAPLRGTTVPAGSVRRPALAAKIDNLEDARPQWGLERADVVFEELVEGGLTRYLGVWHSDVPDLIGPIRSIRPMDPDIVAPFGGIIAYSGGQPIFVGMMEATGLYNAVHGNADTAGLFFRTDERESPHDVLLRAPELISAHRELAAPPQQFAYGLDAASSSAGRSGDPVSRIDVVFSDSRYPAWAWSAKRGQYLRLQEGAPDTDSAGAQLGATNVVVLRVAIDRTFGSVPKTVLVGSGDGWLATGGKAVHVTWSKAASAAPIQLLDDLGLPARLAPGNTWIELLPDDGLLTLTP